MPRNAFFNTAQPTHILCLERKKVNDQTRPAVFCGIARTIGETLDYERVSTKENDLADLAELFVEYVLDPNVPTVTQPTTYRASAVAKLVPAEEFSETSRWDVSRSWTDTEHVALGERAQTITREEFIDQARTTLDELLSDLDEATKDLTELVVDAQFVTLSLGDKTRFSVRSGIRITNADIRAAGEWEAARSSSESRGSVPIYSCFRDSRTTKGAVSLEFLDAVADESSAERPLFPAKPETMASVTVNANGATGVGRVFVRPPGVIMTDDVIIVQPIAATQGESAAPQLAQDIDLNYLGVALAESVGEGGFLYEAKPFAKRVGQLEVRIPTADDGGYDLERQKAIADAVRRLNDIRDRMRELGAWAGEVRLA